MQAVDNPVVSLLLNAVIQPLEIRVASTLVGVFQKGADIF